MSSYAKLVDEVYSEFQRKKSKSEVMEWLKHRYEDGFRYVVRDFGSDWLSVYSMKPKRYTMDECWGYQERNWNDIESMPVKIIMNTDMPEINWNNKSATDIEKLLAKWGKAHDGTR